MQLAKILFFWTCREEVAILDLIRKQILKFTSVKHSCGAGAAPAPAFSLQKVWTSVVNPFGSETFPGSEIICLGSVKNKRAEKNNILFFCSNCTETWWIVPVKVVGWLFFFYYKYFLQYPSMRVGSGSGTLKSRSQIRNKSIRIHNTGCENLKLNCFPCL